MERIPGRDGEVRWPLRVRAAGSWRWRRGAAVSQRQQRRGSGLGASAWRRRGTGGAAEILVGGEALGRGIDSARRRGFGAEASRLVSGSVRRRRGGDLGSSDLADPRRCRGRSAAGHRAAAGTETETEQIGDDRRGADRRRDGARPVKERRSGRRPGWSDVEDGDGPDRERRPGAERRRDGAWPGKERRRGWRLGAERCRGRPAEECTVLLILAPKCS
ncbi:hypothetical protein PVAP13_4KG108615 [Panicum virgatum]|uniref:Uncharacterized protein n=1 Tax=Panicum virgatum TaxID=38727 RepID=A0A8T0TUZ4_PANVG|nr:hypothetical protein PVAP13_4KG108615 [Panicum virgatum]